MFIDFKREIEALRQSFMCDYKNAMKLSKPHFIAHETWHKNYEELSALKETGDIHYASLVQANVNLFKYSVFSPQYIENAPAAIIFSTDRYYDENPLELQKIATTLFGYKGINELTGSVAPENLKIIVDAVTDEYQCLYNVKLPDDISNKTDVFYTTIMVYRQHIPDKKIIGSIFPVVTRPNNLLSTMILPKQYWTSKFIDFNKKQGWQFNR